MTQKRTGGPRDELLNHMILASVDWFLRPTSNKLTAGYDTGIFVEFHDMNFAHVPS